MTRNAKRLDRVRSVLSKRQTGIRLVMENIHDPHNVSAMIRTCDAVGMLRVELLYTIEPFPRIGKKSSSSANKWVDRRKHRSVKACYDLLRAEGYTILASGLEEGSKSLFEHNLTGRTAFVFGNEHRGVSGEAAELADGLFKVPMMGMIQSLNVSVACAVTLYEALRQQLLKGTWGGLSDEEIRELYEDWIQR